MKRLVFVMTVVALAARPTPSEGAGGFDRAIEAALPRVVKLYGVRIGQEAGYGSGVIVSEGGLVVTVYSLLIEAKRLRVVTADGIRYGAEIVHRDRDLQLALLQLKRNGAAGSDAEPLLFEFFDLSREASLTPGDWVLAAGNAFKVAAGPEPVSIAHGVFSARTRLDARRRLHDFSYRGDVLVIDAITSNPGAPGGAMVNLRGEFVGMIGRQVVSNLTHTHFNYAVPRDVLHDYVSMVTDSDGAATQLTTENSEPGGSDEMTVRGTGDLGFRLSRVGYKRVLPFVDYVRFGSPAAQVGLRKDDLILSLNGRGVADVAAFDARWKTIAPSEPIDLVIRRGRAINTIRLEPEKP